MTDNTVAVEITANAAGVAPAAAETKSQVSSITGVVTDAAASFAAMGAQAIASLNATAVAAQATAVRVTEISESISMFREMVSGVGEAMLAAFAIEGIAKFAEQMGEASEKTVHTAETFGLTTAEVQKMNAQATLFGVPAEAMSTAMMRADRSFAAAKAGSAAAANAFKEAGVNIHGAYSQTELLNAALAGLANMDAGPAKIAAAMAIFGRNIQAIGPLLGLTKEQVAEANAEIEKFGAVNDVAASKGLALADSQNQGKVAMMGLNLVLTDALAPVLTTITDGINNMIAAFTQSYNSGGVVKTLMEGIAVAIKLVETAVIALAAPFVMVFDEIKGAINIAVDEFNILVAAIGLLGPAWNYVVNAVTGGADKWMQSTAPLAEIIRGIGSAFNVIAPIVEHVISGVIGWIEQLAQTIGNFMSSLPGVGSGFAKIGADAKATLDAMTESAKGTAAAMAKVWGPDAEKPLPKSGGGTTKDDPDSKPKAAKGQESAMAKLQEGFDQEQNAHNTMLTNMQADELAYWSTIANSAAMSTLNDKDQAAVRMKIDTLTHQIAIQGIEEVQAAAKRQAEEAVTSANKVLSEQKSAIAAQIKLVEDQGNRGEISHAQAYEKTLALINQEVEDEEAAAHKIAAARATADGIILRTSEANTKQYKDALADLVNQYGVYQQTMTAANAQGNQMRSAADQKAIDQTVQQWTNGTKGIVDTWVSGARQMMQGTETWQQFEMKLWNQVLDQVVTMVEKMIMKWIAHEAAKTAATTIGNAQRTTANATGATTSAALDFEATVKAVTNAAVKAASGAYSAMAGIPVVGPALGAAAAGATFVAVEAFGAMASASQGFDIPTGVNPITQLHQEEMVLPATLANPLRSMLGNASGSGGGAGFSGGGGGDTHHHNYNINAMDGQSVLRTLRNNKDHVQTVMREMVRGGKAPAMGIATA